MFIRRLFKKSDEEADKGKAIWVRRCPKCFSRRNHLFLGGMYSPQTYKCGDCGFIGVTFIEEKWEGDGMRLIKFESKEELEQFLESDDPIAQLAAEEGCSIGDKCDNCEKEFEVIISGGVVNYYLCSEHFDGLKNLLSQ